MVTRSIRITKEINEQLRKEAEKLGISVNALIALKLAKKYEN